MLDPNDSSQSTSVNVRRRLDLPDSFPKIITLCGSTRFLEAFQKANRELTLQGHIVISVGMFGHAEKAVDMDSPIKVALDELHKRKIDLADAIFVVNEIAWQCIACGKLTVMGEQRYTPEGLTLCCHTLDCLLPYIGSSTRSEVAYAQVQGKEVLYLNPPLA